MPTCADLHVLAPPASLVAGCDEPRPGVLRLATRFAYPNGDLIDVFVEKTRGLIEQYVLSDCGQTFLYLDELECRMDGTPARKQWLDDICRDLGVRFSGGNLLVELETETSDLSEQIVRLSQACIRVSDFAIHARQTAPRNVFKGHVESFLHANKLQYVPNRKHADRFGSTVKVDFDVQGKAQSSLVLLINGMSGQAVHGSATEVFSRWSRLSERVAAKNALVTIYDSESQGEFLRPSDAALLETRSAVFAYPRQADELAGRLAA